MYVHVYVCTCIYIHVYHEATLQSFWQCINVIYTPWFGICTVWLVCGSLSCINMTLKSWNHWLCHAHLCNIRHIITSPSSLRPSGLMIHNLYLCVMYNVQVYLCISYMYACMYVCTYVGMSVCTYVHMYLCAYMYVCMYVSVTYIPGSILALIYLSMQVSTNFFNCVWVIRSNWYNTTYRKWNYTLYLI